MNNMEEIVKRSTKFLDQSMTAVCNLLNETGDKKDQMKLCEVIISAFISEVEMREKELIKRDEQFSIQNHSNREIKRNLGNLLKIQAEQEKMIKNLNQQGLVSKEQQPEDKLVSINNQQQQNCNQSTANSHNTATTKKNQEKIL